jgi:hypothetical protein
MLSARWMVSHVTKITQRRESIAINWYLRQLSRLIFSMGDRF